MSIVKMHTISWCIICLTVCFLSASGTLLVVNTGQTENVLEYKILVSIGSMGDQIHGMVALAREEVWLYNCSWPDKTKVN